MNEPLLAFFGLCYHETPFPLQSIHWTVNLMKP